MTPITVIALAVSIVALVIATAALIQSFKGRK